MYGRLAAVLLVDSQGLYSCEWVIFIVENGEVRIRKERSRLVQNNILCKICGNLSVIFGTFIGEPTWVRIYI